MVQINLNFFLNSISTNKVKFKIKKKIIFIKMFVSIQKENGHILAPKFVLIVQISIK